MGIRAVIRAITIGAVLGAVCGGVAAGTAGWRIAWSDNPAQYGGFWGIGELVMFFLIGDNYKLIHAIYAAVLVYTVLSAILGGIIGLGFVLGLGFWNRA